MTSFLSLLKRDGIIWTFFNASGHSGQVIKGGGDKTVPIERKELKFGIFFKILSE